MATNYFWKPIVVGYDSIEASLSRLKHELDVSASLQRRRWPDEAQLRSADCSTLEPYRN